MPKESPTKIATHQKLCNYQDHEHTEMTETSDDSDKIEFSEFALRSLGHSAKDRPLDAVSE